MAIAATVSAVVATLAVPSWLAAAPQVSGVPRPPAPTPTPDAPGTRTWQPIRCPRATPDSCAAPAQIDHAGVLLHTVGRGRQATAATGVALVATMGPSRHNRWVLVGAEGPGADSRITVVVGASTEAVVPPGRLSLFSLPGRRRVVVRVADLGRPRVGEVLLVQQYQPG
jgi:hypothetical protein